jgi:nucleoside-diphosphate-sugar epimerase
MRSLDGKTVAVVGGAGFLGSHMVNHLIEDRGCRVVVLDNLCAGRREFMHPRAKFIYADITQSESFLRKTFESEKVEFVASYAAHPYVPDSFARPLHVFNVNAAGAFHVINAAQEAGCEAILQISSAELYGELGIRDYDDRLGAFSSGKVVKLDEFTNVCPHSTYGAAKAAIDALVQVRWVEADTPCIALRQFNCVGERETHPYVVPEIISQVYHGKEDPSGRRYVRLGNNSARDFLYAGDAVRMAAELLEKGDFGEVYNLGSEESVRIYDLAQLVSDVIGCGRVTVVEDQSRVRPWEIWALCSNNEKIYSVIDARPQVPLKEALARTVAYYRENGCRWVWE